MSDDETKLQLDESTDKEKEEEEQSEEKQEKDEPTVEEKMEEDTTKVEEEEKEEEEKKEVEEAEEKEQENENENEKEKEVKKEEKETKQETPVKDPPETPPKEDVRPLYDQPLEMSGKRDRKKVERFVQETKKEELEASGEGTPLGDIPYINYMIMKMQTDDLKILHRVAYSRPGSGNEVKKNLKKFNGFPYTKDDKKYGLKLGTIERIVMSEIKKMLSILGLERAGNKGEVAERLMDFMLKPEDRGRKPPDDAKKLKGRGRGRPKKSGNTQDKKKKNNTSAESIKSDDSDSDNSADESGDDHGEEEEEEEVEEEKPKKAPKKTPAKKTPAKKATSAKKTAPAKRSKAMADSDSDSDDEPLAKKVKQPPSDTELKGMVKKILDGANLEEITMKSVCRQVYDNYPEFDLAHKKDFIKETVKSIIS